MTQEVTKWPVWRTRRLVEIMKWKAKGLSDEEVGEKIGRSRETVNREVNSPQARAIGQALSAKAGAIVWPLVERQVEQIEKGDLKPGQQVSFRGQLIKTLSGLVPKQVEQRIEQKVKLEVKEHKWSFDEVLEE